MPLSQPGLIQIAPMPPATTRPVAILGSGMWATTLAQAIASRGHDVRMWCRNPDLARAINQDHENAAYLPGYRLSERIIAEVSPAACVAAAEVFIVVVASSKFRSLCQEIAPAVRPDHIGLHFVKGIEERTFKRMSEVLLEETCVRQFGVLGGPPQAAEILQGRPTALVIGTAHPRVHEIAVRLLTTEGTRVYHNDDVIGVEVGGALSTVLAIGAGIVRGLQLGENANAVLMTRGLQELARVGRSMGARTTTFSGVSTIGNLMNAAISASTREVKLGEALAQGRSLYEMTWGSSTAIEGVSNSVFAWEYSRKHEVIAPLLCSIYSIVHGGRSPVRALRDLMLRQYPLDVDFG